MIHPHRTLVPLLVILGVATSGCSDFAMYAGDLGVTQGGSQDIRLAREIIESGGIPGEETFTAEGLFSEHDLPLDNSGPCEEILCPRAAAALVEPVDHSGEQLLVQLGFDTSLTADTFQRRPLNLAVAVDVSGSMADGKLDAVKVALDVLVDQLDDGDHMALVAFDDHAWMVENTRLMDGNGREIMHAAVEHLQTGGGTCIECGLELAYGQVTPEAGRAGIEDRVMLLTDAQPNVGETSISSFVGMSRYYGAAGIGLSLFGVGMDMGAELANEVSQVRGGNYFYLSDIAAIREVFNDEFDYMVTPLAYDLRVRVSPTAGLRVVDAYAAPLDKQGEAVDFGATTLFLSSNDGGMGLTLVGDSAFIAPGQVATFEMLYTVPDADSPVEQSVAVQWNGGEAWLAEGAAADDLGVFKMAHLVDEYLALLTSADFCSGRIRQQLAQNAVGDAQRRLQAVSAQLHDDDLGAEADLMAKLAENLSYGSVACW